MRIIAAIWCCLHKSLDWRGRARRSEFWYFVAFWMGAAVSSTYGVELPTEPHQASAYVHAVLSAPVMLIPLALLVPLIAVAVRRMHDIELSGWWLLSIGLPIPVVDALVLGAQVFCFARPGTEGDNRYGPDPRRKG